MPSYRSRRMIAKRDSSDAHPDSLPSSRVFVLQFTNDAGFQDAKVRGRVEHLDSGHSRRFRSLEDLVSFLTDALVATRAES